MSVRTERKQERKRTAVAVAISVLIHLLLLLAAALILALKPAHLKRRAAVQPTPTPPPIKLMILPAPTPVPTPATKEFFDSAQGEVSTKPPENVVFESDRDTKAASEQAAKSRLPVPTTDGEEAPGLTLTARALSLGPAKQPSQPAPASPPKPQTPPRPQEKTEPTPEPQKPEPTPPQQKPSPSPTATPSKPRPTPRPEDAELAMLDPMRPKPTPKPAASPKPEEKPTEQAPPSQPQPLGFQPQTRVTRLVGGISTKGRASIGAEASPLGRYKKQISDAIGSRWYYYVSDMIDLVNVGTVQLTFVVSQNGKVTNVRVVRNTSNESLASCSVRSIVEAEIPPMPKEVLNAVAGGRIEVDFTFAVTR